MGFPRRYAPRNDRTGRGGNADTRNDSARVRYSILSLRTPLTDSIMSLRTPIFVIARGFNPVAILTGIKSVKKQNTIIIRRNNGGMKTN